MFSLAVAPCLVSACVRTIFVISCACYVMSTLFARLFLRLYMVSFDKLVVALLRAGIAESVFCYRFETPLARPVVRVVPVIPVVFFDTVRFFATFL